MGQHRTSLNCLDSVIYFYAKLRADNTAVPVGGSVTLTCSVNPSSSSGWKYYWYKDDSGEPLKAYYRYTEWSQFVRIDTTGEFKCNFPQSTTSNVPIRPVVTLYPNWSEIYRGETITVRCEIHGGDTEWDYEWETNSMIKPPNQNEYRIRSASSSNSGNYRCKGRMKSSQHKTTDKIITLTVSCKLEMFHQNILNISGPHKENHVLTAV
uniref:Ig-like domain-containing protein n=1 Tax=Astatotilapia calliptera TaxID=8154 RepID=A0A3P8PTH9_ASTCA